METRPKWFEKFGISDGVVQRFKAERKADQNFLDWCLTNGILNEAEFMEWASTEYEIPYVDSSFFLQVPNVDFWDDTKELSSWNKDFFPLTEWDGTYLIGCTEPLPGFEWDRPFRFILASPRNLKILWDHLNPDSAAPQPQASAAIGLPTLTVPPAGLTGDFSVSAQTTPPLEAEVASEPEAPSGLNLDHAASVDFGSLGKSSAAPQGIIHSPFDDEEDSPLEKTQAPPEFPPITASAPPPSPSTSTNFVLKDSPKEAAKPQTKTFKVELRKEVESGKSLDLGSMTPPPTGRANDLAPPQAPKPPPTQSAAGKFENCQSFEETASLAFLKMQGTYDKACFLIFQGGDLRPWKWTGNYTPAKPEKPKAVDLSEASIFRIVFNTSLPYHGRIVVNEANNTFFDDMDDNRIPKHVTIIPVIVQKQIAGMILGSTNGEINVRNSLLFMESLGSEVSRAFERIRSRRAA